MPKKFLFIAASAVVILSAAVGYVQMSRMTSSGDVPEPDSYPPEATAGTDKSIDRFLPRQNDRTATVDGLQTPPGFFRLEDLPSPESVQFASIEEMASAAENGDNVAAVQLFRMAQKCAGREIQLADAEALAAAGHADAAEQTITNVEYLAPTCEQMSTNTIQERTRFIRMAAERGDVRAQIDFLTAAPSHLETLQDPQSAMEFRDAARRYLHSAANAGSLDAIGELAHQYNDGLFASDPQSQVWAAALMDVSSRNGVPYSDEIYATWSAGLTEGQLNLAAQIADRIDESCC